MSSAVLAVYVLYICIGCLTCCFVAAFFWSAFTNPFSRLSIIRPPFTVTVDETGAFVLHRHFSLVVRAGRLWQTLGIIKSAVHIVANTIVGSAKARARTEEGIITRIHQLRFNPKHPFLISGDHFAMLYPRSLGIFYHSLLDPRTARTEHDWHDRQATYLQTLAYALEVFRQTDSLATTIIPLWRRSVFLTNIFNPPADTLYSLLYAFKALSTSEELTHIYRPAPASAFTLQTKRASLQLLAEHADTLRRHLQHFTHDVYDQGSGLIRSDTDLSGTKDISHEKSGFYSNVIFWKTQLLAMELGLIPEDQQFLQDLKQRILEAFWLPQQGHFLEDLSPEAHAHAYYSSDWLIVLMTGFLDPAKPAERQYFIRSVQYIQNEGLDQPFGLKYQQVDRTFREHGIDKLFVPDYGGTAIWSQWGMEYIKLLTLLSIHTKDPAYLHQATYQLEQYQHNIEKYHGYPELYHKNGRIFRHLFYKSVRQTGWVVCYEQARLLVRTAKEVAPLVAPHYADINLFLGPGAARGFMHLGAIRALTEQGYRVRSLIGTSSGAFIALLYAKFNDVDAIERLIEEVPFQSFLRRNRRNMLSIDREAITAYFVKLFGSPDITFSDLALPIAFVATNLRTGRPEYLHTGKVLPALLASASLPVLNPPEYIGGTPYIDGGLIYNMPVTLPAAFVNKHRYIGINVAYYPKFRRNKVTYARQSFVRALSLFYGHRARRQTDSQLYNPVRLYQIVVDDRRIKPADFRKMRECVIIGYQAAATQLATLFAQPHTLSKNPVTEPSVVD